MQLRLHNTLTRTKEVFEPLDPGNVRMYVCGPTVYQRIHVGNARAFVVFDVLYRLLRHLYGEDKVTYVRNITDIDDKIIDQARKDGIDIRELTERTTRLFHEDLAALGCLPPTHEPRATEHVGNMLRLIDTLISRGHAYVAEGHVLFHVPSMPAYGRLSGRNRDEQIAGARVDVAPYKRDPADFVLWKPSAPEQPGWDSPYGRGRPGWHIECSAMSEALLGPLPFDIHAGGLDLIFPHHENEIAQSCCAHGVEQMARYWLHNGFLDMRGEKMSKSLGNVVRVPEALEMTQQAYHPGEVLRLALLNAQYRQPADFTREALHEAKRTLTRFYGALDRTRPAGLHDPEPALIDALVDDLNTPKALNILHELLAELNRTGDPHIAGCVRSSAILLGLLQEEPGDFLKGPYRAGTSAMSAKTSASVEGYAIHSDMPADQIEHAISLRTKARKQRDFALADKIRADLSRAGVLLEDRPDGTTDWRRA